ncbi:hypothetical protein MJO28_015649 [Puccinia striiformis f. sp. tritici]|uniref:Uncharacterized protein n=1 Tax=Puccinia striiformis f. sp. tritici TaxID=168172 RepID=A0ACC0DR93_9BASI|nr:hypothetical protein MJO28_015649 [Puccinia striiformis f. sp. tritici]
MPPDVAVAFGRITACSTAGEVNAPDNSSGSEQPQLAPKEIESTPSQSAATLNEPTIKAATVHPEPVKSDTPPSSTLNITETDLVCRENRFDISPDLIKPLPSPTNSVNPLKNPELICAIDQVAAQKIEPMDLKSISQPPTTEAKPKEWIAYKDAIYTILEEDISSIKIYLEYDGIGLVETARHLDLALNLGLAKLRRCALHRSYTKRVDLHGCHLIRR